MKKTLLIVTVAILALGALGVGVAFAQSENPPFGGRGPADGTGTLHNYMEQAMADALGISLDEFESRREAGETFYAIALEEGFTAEEIPALMQAARDAALDAAAADGVISQEQADWMKSRGFGRGGMMSGYGYGDGTCPMYSDGANPQSGYGRGQGQGGMMGGWRNP